MFHGRNVWTVSWLVSEEGNDELRTKKRFKNRTLGITAEDEDEQSDKDCVLIMDDSCGGEGEP